MTARLIGLLALLVIVQCASAQPDTLWSEHFGGAQEDICRALIETSDGGFALFGQTASFGAGGRDYWLVRTDAQGQQLWTQTYGGGSDDYGTALCQTADGGFALAGRTNSPPGSWNGWIVRTNSSGDTLWTRKLGGSARDECNAIVALADGGFVCAGYTLSYGVGGDFWLFKLNANGDSLWSHHFGGGGSDICLALLQTTDGGFLLGGQTQSYGPNLSSPNYWLLRTNESGDSLWARVYGGSSNDVCTSLAPYAGGYLLGGYTTSFGAGQIDAWLLRADANGDTLWGRTFGTGGIDMCTAVLQGRHDQCVLAGYRGATSNYWLLGTDSTGTQVWQANLGGNSPDDCYAALLSQDNAFVLAGGSFSFTNGAQDFWAIKSWAGLPGIHVSPAALNFGDVQIGAVAADSVLIENVGDINLTLFEPTVPEGFETNFLNIHQLAPLSSEWLTVVFVPQFAQPYSGQLCLHSTAVNGDSCVELSGVGVGDASDDDEILQPSTFSLSVYPNPFNATTSLTFTLPQPEHVALSITDITGRRVASFANENFPAGEHHVMFNAENLPSGIYFAQLHAPSFSKTQKLVLLK